MSDTVPMQDEPKPEWRVRLDQCLEHCGEPSLEDVYAALSALDDALERARVEKERADRAVHHNHIAKVWTSASDEGRYDFLAAQERELKDLRAQLTRVRPLVEALNRIIARSDTHRLDHPNPDGWERGFQDGLADGAYIAREALQEIEALPREGGNCDV